MFSLNTWIQTDCQHAAAYGALVHGEQISGYQEAFKGNDPSQANPSGSICGSTEAKLQPDFSNRGGR